MKPRTSISGRLAIGASVLGTSVLRTTVFGASVFGASMLALASGCAESTDPASPCPTLRFGDADPGVLVSASRSPVIAVSSRQARVLVHWVCGAGGSDEPSTDEQGDCELRREALPALQANDPVMLTSGGHYVTALDAEGQQLTWYRVREDGTIEDGRVPSGGGSNIASLVGSLRAGDWMLVRDGSNRLRRYRPGESTELLAPDEPSMRLEAIGERWILGSTVDDGGRSKLFLVGVDPDVRPSGPRVLALVEGPAFSRTFLTPGDRHAVVTSGEGQDAETLVFSVPNGELVDRFRGASVSGRVRGQVLPGLSSIAPDGSHLAYRTPTGAAAMRDLDLGSSCLVRSASAGDHRLIGFSADGTLFLEAETSIGRQHVLAYDPSDAHVDELSTDGDRIRLAAVAGRTHPERGSVSWAVGVRNGWYAALQPDAPPSSLSVDDVMFLPRDDAGLWLANTSDLEDSSLLSVSLQRISPVFDERSGAFAFPNEIAGPELPVLAAGVRPSERLCISAGTPGSVESRCGSAGDTSSWLAAAQVSEPSDPAPLPDEEPIPTADSCPGGWPLATDDVECPYFTVLPDGSDCCFRSQTNACEALSCIDDCSIAGTPPQVVCGASAESPDFG